MPLLTCPHCGSALTAPDAEAAPLRCPVCGATLTTVPGVTVDDPSLPIREAVVWEEEDDSATRAVAPERLAPIIAQATTDHFGAQSAEIPSIEARTADPITDETTKAVPFSPPAPAAGNGPAASEVTQDLPLSALPQAESATAEAPAQRSSGGALRAISLTLVALTLVAVIVVAALMANGAIGGRATSTTQATPTSTPLAPTATPAVAVFSPSGLYQVTYPQGWTIQQRNSPPKSYYALLTAPSGGASVNIAAQQAASAPAPDILDQQFLDALAQPGATLTPSGAPTSVTVAGQTWTQLAADVTLRVVSGQPAQYAHVVALSTQHGDYTYTIVYLAPSPSAAAAGPAFTTANAAYFQPMLASFAFAS